MCLVVFRVAPLNFNFGETDNSMPPSSKDCSRGNSASLVAFSVQFLSDAEIFEDLCSHSFAHASLKMFFLFCDYLNIS